jgi:hypothetical protein
VNLARAFVVFGAASELQLFAVQKSDNRNELVYFVRVDDACALLGEQPVFARWHMRERGEGAWEELTPMERRFYGLAEQARVDAQTVGTYAHGAPEHPFTVRVANVDGRCTATAEASFGGTRSVIARVALELGFLSVKRAIVFGRDDLGRAVTAHLR